MKKQNWSLIFLGLLFLFGCKTPTVEKTSAFTDRISFLPIVQYQTDNAFVPNEIECIAVGTIEDRTEQAGFEDLKKTEIVRRVVHGILGTKNYKDVELSRVDYILQTSEENLLARLNCDAILKGKILKFENSSVVAYSVTTVEIELTLIDKNGTTLWSGRHAANSHEGALPLSPISLISGIFVATTNRQDEVALQMVDTAVRRVLGTLPDRDEFVFIGNLIPQELQSSTSKEATLVSQKLLNEGAYENALISAQMEIQKNLKNVAPLLVASEASLYLGNYEKAENFAIDALLLEENNLEALNLLGSSYIKMNKLKLAEGAFVKITKAHHATSEHWYLLGLVQVGQSDFETASSNLLTSGIKSIEEKKFDITLKNLKKLKNLAEKSLIDKQKYIELGQKVGVELAKLKS